MDQSDTQLIRFSATEEPCDLVCRRVMNMIETAELRRCRTRSALHITLAAGSILVFIPAVKFWVSDMSASGFGTYISLVISDGAYLTGHIRELALSIADSVPFLPTTIILLLTVICANSIRRIAHYRISLSTHRERLQTGLI